MFVFMWALGQPLSTLWDQVFRQLSGRIISATGWAVDAVDDAFAAVAAATSAIRTRVACSLIVARRRLMPGLAGTSVSLAGKHDDTVS